MAIATRCEQRALRRVSEERVFMSHGENIFGARIVASLGLLLCALILAQRIASQEQKSPRSTNAGQRLNTSNVEGKQVFESRCAGCHGLDGRGGERAPDIASNAKTQQRSDGELFRIVEQGLPGTGMPAFASLGTTSTMSSHICASFKARKNPQDCQAIAKRGRELFYGKGRCSDCHAIAASGGFIASELTGYAGNRSQTKFARQSSSRLVGTVWAEK